MAVLPATRTLGIQNKTVCRYLTCVRRDGVEYSSYRYPEWSLRARCCRPPASVSRVSPVRTEYPGGMVLVSWLPPRLRDVSRVRTDQMGGSGPARLLGEPSWTDRRFVRRLHSAGRVPVKPEPRKLMDWRDGT